jgi:hypothetical protein
MTDTTTPAPAADPRPELKASPPQLTRRDNPMEVRHASTSLNALTARVQQTLGAIWLLNDNLPRAVDDLAEVAERALALRRLLITLTTPPPAKDT